MGAVQEPPAAAATPGAPQLKRSSRGEPLEKEAMYGHLFRLQIEKGGLQSS